jgi:putative thioredoxin
MTAVFDVTDATFQTDVLDRSDGAAVVIDLWAPWCGPCKQLGPILEKVVGETEGKVVLAKVNVDENPGISQAFRVQSIPAVFAIKGGQIVDGFVGAQGEGAVREFVTRLLPGEEESELAELIAVGDIPSLRAALELDPDNETAIVKLAELFVGEGRTDEALELLAKIPETPETRRIAALARTGVQVGPDLEGTLDALLDRVKEDEAARQEFIDLLEVMGPEDPRTSAYRRKLTARLF